MSYKLYTVTLTDLGTYRVTVAASYADEAMRIAKTVLLEEATRSAPNLTIVQRDIETIAEVDVEATANAREYSVDSTYSLDFSVSVVAKDRTEAERHARRLVADNGGPFEFYVGDHEYGPWIAREVQP